MLRLLSPAKLLEYWSRLSFDLRIKVAVAAFFCLLTIASGFFFSIQKKQVLNSRASAPDSGILLLPGKSFNIASYNADAYCTNEGKQTLENKGEPNEYWRGCPTSVPKVSWRESMRRYIESGGKQWDIVGLQEAGYPTDPKSDTAYFVRFMKEDYNRDYQCAASPKSTNWKGNVTCSIYPIKSGSIMTLDTDRSFADCMLIETPAGEVVFCNSHPPYQAPVETFNRMQSWILSTVIPAYIPTNLSPLKHESYRKSLIARTILVGDMNIGQSKIVGVFQTTCPGPGDQSGIDHIMYPDMKRPELGGATGPFSTSYLIPSENGCKTTVDQWPTDHAGPVVATFTSKGLQVKQDGTIKIPIDGSSSSVSSLSTSSSESAVLKVMTFNAASRDSAQYQERYDESLVMADFAKTEQIDIIGLQEMNYFPERQLLDGEILQKGFKEKGYPIFVRQVKESKHEANIIASRYPFVEGSYQEYYVEGGRNRIVQKIAVNSPYGKIWVVNLHTNANRPNNPCSQAAEILRVLTDGGSFAPPPNEPLVIMGDFNNRLTESGEVRHCGKGGLTEEIKKFTVACEDVARCTNLIPERNTKDNDPYYIDWVISSKSSGTRILAVWEAQTVVKTIGDGHPVILGEITSPLFALISPTPTGQITPNPFPSLFQLPNITPTQLVW